MRQSPTAGNPPSGLAYSMAPVSDAQQRKLHLGVDEAAGEIIVAVVTTNDIGDEPVPAQLSKTSARTISQTQQCRRLCSGAKQMQPDIELVIMFETDFKAAVVLPTSPTGLSSVNLSPSMGD